MQPLFFPFSEKIKPLTLKPFLLSPTFFFYCCLPVTVYSSSNSNNKFPLAEEMGKWMLVTCQATAPATFWKLEWLHMSIEKYIYLITFYNLYYYSDWGAEGECPVLQYQRAHKLDISVCKELGSLCKNNLFFYTQVWRFRPLLPPQFKCRKCKIYQPQESSLHEEISYYFQIFHFREENQMK